jgi:flagellar protein FliS
MNNNSPASAYQQSAAHGASPVGRVVALYDTLLRDFRRALAAQEASQIETRVFELNHALTVIAHLRSVLDHQRGGEAAARLSRLYEVTHSMILEANISGTRTTLLKLIEMFGGLRQAWEQAERQLTSSTSAALRASAPAAVPDPPPQNTSASMPNSFDASAPATSSVNWNA